uniref:Uncharacterized protein n=1 Tax=Kalanchoe fedtschenkoi TaxID=63787 RepID=A0A7N0SYZ6_KALFE
MAHLLLRIHSPHRAYCLPGHWFMSLLGIPYLLYNARLYSRREHLLDVTEIFNTLNLEKKKRLFKLGYVIMLLCLSLFWLLLSALDDEE